MSNLVELASLFVFGLSIGYTLPLIVKLTKLYFHK